MKFYSLLIAFFFSISLFAQNLSVQVDVVYLSSDLLEGRETGSKGEKMAADYIASRFKSLGLTPAGVDGSWFQSFDFSVKDHPHAEGNGTPRTGKNVLGFLDNGASHTIIIGAHYDHLGYGHSGSLHRGEPAIHNGADDNASGIAAMLYLVEKLKNSTLKTNNYLFMAFSGEEFGLFGSKYYATNPTLPIQNVNYMLNMDMVGRLNEENVLVINGVGTSPAWKPFLEGTNEQNLKLTTTESGFGPSDHTSFYLQDLPVLHFFTGQHTDYHKPSDDSELINYDGIVKVSDFIMDLISDLDGKGKLEFTKTKDENEGRRASSFKVSLGVIPDYTYSGTGMRIDGATDGRAGHSAGLVKGDIILKIGELDIKDIYGYMDALSKFEPGSASVIQIKRGEEILDLKVTF
ncbi:MAG: hypothetical protein RJA52_238 [Bacteroidota bacterium]